MELVSRCVECGLAEPESLASLGGSAPGVVDGILSLCASRPTLTIIVTRAQRARAPQAPPPQGNMNQGQQAPPTQAPPAQPAAAAAPPVLLATQPPPPVGPAPPAPAFALGPGRSHVVLNFDCPTTGATATKLYNKAISPLEGKFNGEADNLAVFLCKHT